jgi:hypothetical protein
MRSTGSRWGRPPNPRHGRLLLAALGAVAAVIAGERQARADAMTVCIAASESALGLKKQGKLRESLGPFAACADRACPDEVRAECEKQIESVKAQMPALTIIVKDRDGHDLFGVKVTMDGAPFTGAFDGRPLALDPGEHAFHFEAPGLVPIDRNVVLLVGEKDRRETIILLPIPAASYWTAPRIAGLVGMGLGVAGLVTGAVFTGFAASAKSKEQSDCASASACINYLQAQEDYNTATKNGTGATVGFVAGGVLAAAGLVVFLTAPRPTAAPPVPPRTGVRSLRFSPLVAAAGGGLSIGGSF